MYAQTADGMAASGGSVYLSFTPATGGGAASVNGTALTATPAAFTANASGELTVTYTAPATLPSTGTDTLTAANAASSPTAAATDTYTFLPATTTVSGTAARVTITIITTQGVRTTYVLAPGYTVTIDGHAGSLADLTTGESVTLTLNASQEVTAVTATTSTDH